MKRYDVGPGRRAQTVLDAIGYVALLTFMSGILVIVNVPLWWVGIPIVVVGGLVMGLSLACTHYLGKMFNEIIDEPTGPTIILKLTRFKPKEVNRNAS